MECDARYSISSYEMPLWKGGPSEKDIDRMKNALWNERMKGMLENSKKEGFTYAARK